MGNAVTAPTSFIQGVIMKKLLIAAAIVTVSLSALADGEPYVNTPLAGSGITRAQVLNELKSAAADRALVSGEGSSVSGMQAHAVPQSTRMLSRAEVRAELDRARRNGELYSGEFRSTPPVRAAMDMQIARH
jgi:hypothetical protein